MKIGIYQNGYALREYFHEGTRYVETPPSGDYTVRITNDTPRRRLAVLSVDGINVLNGADADFGGPGYVLEPWASVDVPGWRRDSREVANFSFREQSESYASQTGRGVQNVGVVGVAVYDERVRVAPKISTAGRHKVWPQTGAPRASWSSRQYCSSSLGEGTWSTASELCARGTAPTVACAADVGTAYGQVATFHTQDVVFERASAAPVEVTTLRYATRERLQSWGVVGAVQAQVRPQAFPLSQGQGCPPPPGWRG